MVVVSACLCLAAALLSPDGAFGRQPILMPVAAGGSEATGIVPLVNADDLLARFLRQAQDFIKQEQYSPAIELLQALIRKHDSGVVPTAGGRQFVSLWLTANQLIGSMPPRGLLLYRTLHDPPAQQLYDRAVLRSDTSALRRVVQEYLHSSYGAKALDSLGTIYFDRGRFFRAARSWRQGLALDPKRKDKALVLAKIATAYHLGADADAANEVIARIKADHASATAVLGGKKQNIVAFLKRVRTLEPVAANPRGNTDASWSGLGGAADGQSIMAIADVVLMPRWRKPPLLSKLSLPGDLVALKHDLVRSNYPHYSSSRTMPATASLKNGHVHASTRYGSQLRKFICPPTLYPVVSGETVLCRTDKAVVAYDAYTGTEKWHSESFPMYRTMSGVSMSSSSYYGGYVTVGDRGWHTVTVAEGKVFTIGNFRPSMHPSRLSAALRSTKDKRGQAMLADTSNLTAMSLKGGKKLWEIGHIAGGSDEVLRACKFISAPTYHRSKLYVMAIYLESYYVLCLDASNGQMLWRSLVSQTPVVNLRYGPHFAYLLERGSGPAVADGQVYAVTNAGVVSAFDAESGQTLWAHQYPGDAKYSHSYSSSSSKPVFNPPNPIIISRGQVVCLPADSSKLMALSVDDGSLSWETDRKGQRHLSAVDESRVMLSAPGQMIVAVAKRAARRVLHPAGAVDDKGIVGRPAVTPTEAVSSGEARLVRLNLADYHTEVADLGHAGGLLGNLVSAEGKLIAANTVGLCAYFNYDHARKRLSERIAQAGASQQPGLIYQRAQLAFNAKRFTDARDDLLECARQSETADDKQLPFSIRPWLYRTYVALGNRATTDPEMLAMFRQADEYGQTVQERAHMLLRLAKYHERAGQFETAAGLAQELGEKYAEEELVDVRIGPEANDMVRFGADMNRFRGKQLAQAFIERLIQLKGRQVYAQFDSKAASALDEASKTGDPEVMAAVARRWQHSASADDALMAAAETYYKQALPIHEQSKKLKAQGEKMGMAGRDLTEQGRDLRRQADTLFGRAVQYLSRVAGDKGSDLRLKANVAVAVIHARRGVKMTAAIQCDEVRRGCKKRKDWSLGAVIAFGEVKGTVDSILKSVESGKLPVPRITRRRYTSTLSTPLRKIFAIADPTAQILRDQNYQPVRMGQYIFVVKGKDVLLFDTLAPSAEAAVRWSGLTSVDATQQEQYYSYPPGWRLCGALSKDNRFLVVADRKSVAGLDVQSGKAAWRKTLPEAGVAKFGCMSVGQDVIVFAGQDGSLTCLDLASGNQKWQAKMGGRISHVSGSPRIGAGIVLATSNVGREMSCYSIRTGKLLASWSARTYAQATVTDTGFVILMIDGTLSVREIAKLGESPIWKKEYPATRQVAGRAVKDYAAILRVSDDRIVVSPGQATGKIEVLSLTAGGQGPTMLETNPVGGSPGLPVDAWFDNGDLYVACSIASTGRRKQTYGLFSVARGLSLQKFRLDGNKDSIRPIWSRDLDTDPRSHGQVVPLTIAGAHVVAFVKHYQTNRPIEAFVLNAEAGKTLEKIDLAGAGQDAAARVKRQRMIGPPVVTNGRMCAETCEGITVYGGQ